MTLHAAGPNAEQIEYWNETSASKWVELESLLDEQIAPLGLAAIEAAAIRAGERVLDVGCGCGQTSLQLAERTGSSGHVMGIDIATAMLARARERAAAAAQAAISFTNADAQTHAFEAGSFDLVFSRFGVMFFTDPTAAFTNLRRALAPGGRLSFVCWQGLAKNAWMSIPIATVAKHVTLPVPSAGAPGPFSFADADRVRGILTAAGFDDVAFASYEEPLLVGGAIDLDGAVDLVLRMGPAAAALRKSGRDVSAELVSEVREALAPFETPKGVRMACGAWSVSARSPA
jgi:SAM-dependent methyltransferase